MTIKLSPTGRQRFGEWVANSCRLAAGGLFGSIVIPSLLGRSVPLAVTVATSLAAVLFAILGAVMYYVTAERSGEA